MPDEFIDKDDLEAILRPPNRIEKDKLGATPNEVAAGLADPDQIVPDPQRPSTIEDQAVLAAD